MGHSANQTYDDKKYVNSVTNFNRITTDYTCDPITGNVTQIRFPLTPAIRRGQGEYASDSQLYLHEQLLSPHRTGRKWPYYHDHARRQQSSYPHRLSRRRLRNVFLRRQPFLPASSHRMNTGGTETFAYDGQHRLQYYSDPTTAIPTIRALHYLLRRTRPDQRICGCPEPLHQF